MAAEEGRVDTLAFFIHSTSSISPLSVGRQLYLHVFTLRLNQRNTRVAEKQSEMKHSNTFWN